MQQQALHWLLVLLLKYVPRFLLLLRLLLFRQLPLPLPLLLLLLRLLRLLLKLLLRWLLRMLRQSPCSDSLRHHSCGCGRRWLRNRPTGGPPCSPGGAPHQAALLQQPPGSDADRVETAIEQADTRACRR